MSMQMSSFATRTEIFVLLNYVPHRHLLIHCIFYPQIFHRYLSLPSSHMPCNGCFSELSHRAFSFLSDCIPTEPLYRFCPDLFTSDVLSPMYHWWCKAYTLLPSTSVESTNSHWWFPVVHDQWCFLYFQTAKARWSPLTLHWSMGGILLRLIKVKASTPLKIQSIA